MKRLIATFIPLAILAFQEAGMACVGCREPGSDTIANEPQTMLAGFGFSWGVLILLGCVAGILGGLVAYICATVARVDQAHRGL